jgi:DNA-directed RNA polymerase subunit RPC12/RpoP
MKTSLNKIVCPYCEEGQGLVTTNDEVYEDVLRCSKCSKLFFVVGYVSWEYTTKKIEGEG